MIRGGCCHTTRCSGPLPNVSTSASALKRWFRGSCDHGGRPKGGRIAGRAAQANWPEASPPSPRSALPSSAEKLQPDDLSTLPRHLRRNATVLSLANCRARAGRRARVRPSLGSSFSPFRCVSENHPSSQRGRESAAADFRAGPPSLPRAPPSPPVGRWVDRAPRRASLATEAREWLPGAVPRVWAVRLWPTRGSFPAPARPALAGQSAKTVAGPSLFRVNSLNETRSIRAQRGQHHAILHASE